MQVKVSFLAMIVAGITLSCQPGSKSNSKGGLEQIKEKTIAKLVKSIDFYKDATLNPRSMEGGEVMFVSDVHDWCGGFYPGCLWYLYELNPSADVKGAAHRHSKLIEEEKYNGRTHDMGFKMYCSFGNGARLTENEEYKNILIQSAQTLITRFNPTVGCLRSWDHNADKWDFPVIIDNMMNLELLMWAFKETKDSVYYNVAVAHANTTLKNHFREDNSTFHVISYDTLTGEVMKKNTHQGLNHESAWSRGQAWGLYGYTMMYRETGIKEYLEQAENIANYVYSHKNMPQDLIPYWDFDAPNIPNEPRDVSAAAIMASALYELSGYNEKKAETYLRLADSTLYTLASNEYFAGENAKHPYLLEHSTGSKPHNSEIDVPLIYADYYFVEALIRKLNIETKN